MTARQAAARPAGAAPRFEGSSPHLDTLFRTEAPRLLRFFRKKTGNRDTAADMVQETFLRLAGADSTGFRNPAAYLQRVARNLLIDRARRTDVKLAPMHLPFDEEIDRAVAADQTDMLEAEDTLGRFEAAILDLNPKTAEIFLLHRIDGLTYDAIREQMNMSLGAVEYHIMRALAHLDEALSDQ
ncbi:MAG: polymerase subunit sigma-24 [Sphingomonas bacterium]|uniref:RNA polymerase sigma factor n=1 Tax=Sphingomonas bacterium TaxID=1895847 RepID=UPI00262B1F39|nr:RNA polymerase sigma factor [Sphingomonas bacterium]MDB5706148.1 polymerase subunit sigma-24 [Sphingomonas bacterium]